MSIIPIAGSGVLSAGMEAKAEFLVTDSKTAKPISGLKPLAWAIKQESNESIIREEDCKRQIHSLHQGRLGQQPAVNFNSFLVLTLNQDNSISVIDPQIAWAKTKLQAMVALPSRGDDWLLDQANSRLYVALPEQAALAVIDTETWQLTNTIKLGSQPSSGDTTVRQFGNYVWVALGESPEIFVVNTADLKTISRIPVKQGLHRFAASKDQRLLFVTNSKATEISVIDTVNLKPVKDIAIKGQIQNIVLNPADKLIYAVTKNTKEISVIDPQKLSVVASIPVEAGITQLRFTDDGRFGFAINQDSNIVSLVDVIKQKIIATAQVPGQPDQVVFSKHYAYVRSLAKAQYSVFDLTQVEKGILAPAMVESGQQPPLSDAGTIGHTDMVAPTPDGHGALLANGPDRKLYYYMEGMMAASGTLDNGGHSPRGILVADRSLQEKSLGRYSVTFKLPAAGLYEIPFFVSQPHLAQCFTMQVLESNGDNAELIKVMPLATDISAKAGETVELGFVAVNGQSSHVTDLKDVTILIVENRHQLKSTRNAVSDKSGIYKIKQKFQRAGQYTALIKIPSHAIDYKRTVSININVSP